uniref:Elongation of fatty acids protein n=1 Tax=Chromera velia CCMP2878 TaxID=1169474 RepID=A0A0G4IAC9_9ALVE|eukprot:Cvel_12461.t1-p1 / transcript=Cvel_12461.t1 / gene=Cvel_12461 / organism=Chromera_velia_CCMP2878 / gene_product=Putative fatty acid elongation protein 3, putative / transcript_product=Putative fatty acid elongation protein 3, putative / location=Cvel_scaffold816:60458-64822(+) / protein_length=415 / sequence_SO=supercontig / SO=protein_coding / is_pseudo=false
MADIYGSIIETVERLPSFARGVTGYSGRIPSVSRLLEFDVFYSDAAKTFPLLAGTETEFEREWQKQSLDLAEVSRRIYWVAPVVCVAYVLVLFGSQQLMQKRPAMSLKGPLACWNFFLALFSLIGFLRTAPAVLSMVFNHGLRMSCCAPATAWYGLGGAGLWTHLFTYSKFFELIDTAFLVLRKREVKFLHWYHHVTVLMLTWDAFARENPIGSFYLSINYGVHALMYFYYGLAAIDIRPSWGMTVTVLQILQMVAGIAVTLFGMSLSYAYGESDAFPLEPRSPSSSSTAGVSGGPVGETGAGGESDSPPFPSPPLSLPVPVSKPAVFDTSPEFERHSDAFFEAHGCAMVRHSGYFALVIYATYLLLFLEFFVGRYIYPKSGGKKGKRRDKKMDQVQPAVQQHHHHQPEALKKAQ